MGLDWCLMDKVVEGQEYNKAFADAHCERINKEIDAAYASYLEERGEEPPMIFPNQLTNEFRETQVFKTLWSELDTWMETRDAVTISPMATMGCPRIGIDEEATTWAKNYYNEIKEGYEADERVDDQLQKRKEQFLDNFPDVEAYIRENHGKHVPELAKNKEGLGLVTGIAVGPESFRGKVLRFMKWLEPSLVDESYENHEPNELEDYGNRLLRAAEEREQSLNGSGTEEDLDEVGTLKAAAAWCIFWGSNGHAMHAWY